MNANRPIHKDLQLPEVITFTPELHLIPLDQKLTGFSQFISSWLYTAGPVFLIDVGPAATAPVLLDVLDRMGMDHIDAILLTHIHLDHAGAIGEVSRAYPKTPVYCHPVAIPHLADPSRLWEGSLKILGATAEAYGPVSPVPEQRLRPSDRAAIPGGVMAIETPGHAIHHVSYQTGPYLFSGEAGGVVFTAPDGSAYMRPATPVRFMFDVFTESLDRLIALSPDAVCYGHFGLQRNGLTLLRRHRDQLKRWRGIISSEMKACARENWVVRCRERLLKEDQDVAAYSKFEPAVQVREKEFFENSIRGFLGYLDAT
mgnify:CR=1 FL=1